MNAPQVDFVKPSVWLRRNARPLFRVGTPGCAVVRALSAALFVSLLTSSLFAQTTIGTGSIVGTVSDPSGAVLSGATVSITNVATGRVVHITTNSSGTFNSGALIPGNYTDSVVGCWIRPRERLRNRARGQYSDGKRDFASRT